MVYFVYLLVQLVGQQKSRESEEEFFYNFFLFFFFSLKEFLPQSYIRANRIEKKIFQEHKAIQGASEIEAKQKYVKLARGLPTFGVHFFLVKVSLKFLKILKIKIITTNFL